MPCDAAPSARGRQLAMEMSRPSALCWVGKWAKGSNGSLGLASIGKPEVHHVTVFDDVVLSLQPHFAGLLGRDLAAQCHEIAVGDGFGADEALLEVAVNGASGLGRLGASGDGPGSRLFGSDREEGDEAEHPIAFTDQPVEAGFLQ